MLGGRGIGENGGVGEREWPRVRVRERLVLEEGASGQTMSARMSARVNVGLPGRMRLAESESESARVRTVLEMGDEVKMERK